MTKKTVEALIKIGVEVVEWVSIVLKDKMKGKEDNDCKGNSKTK